MLKKKSEAGRGCAEYEAARFLYDRYGVVCFPSPNGIYDLLTIDGVRIEVKDNRALTKRQRELGSLDIFMFRYGAGWVFARQEEVLSIATGRWNKTVPFSWLKEWAINVAESWQEIVDIRQVVQSRLI